MKGEHMKETKTVETIAAKRIKMITPLLEEGIDDALIRERKKEIASRHALSYRTISRYHQAYLKDGFNGLKPKTGYKRTDKNRLSNFEEVLEHAIILRRELPSRSVRDIIKIMELEGIVEEGSVSRSTLQRHLQLAGFSSSQMKMYQSTGKTIKRFQKNNRMMLLQGDIKYGPFLPIGKDSSMKQVYLSAMIDDATRYIVACRFYDNQRVEIIEDTLRHAVESYGKPDKIFVDNGKQYRSRWLKNACMKLGIKLSFAKPYSPEAKGKIEFFNKRVDQFLSEVALDKPKTLEELNEKLDLWIQNYYHKNPHTALNGLSPEVAFRSDKRSLRFVKAEELIEAFTHSETRKVDKTGCISLFGYIYEVGLTFIGKEVEVRYDASWKNQVMIYHKDFKPFKASQRVIGENCGYKEDMPEHVKPITTNGSRLLRALDKDQNKTKPLAISFKALGEDDV